MNNKKLLMFFMAMYAITSSAMYKAHCTPFSSSQKELMKTTVYGLIDNAKTSLLVAMFMFTDKEAARKLSLAKARGVHVRVIMDKISLTGKYPMNEFLKEFNVPTLMYSASDSIHHNKYIVVDNYQVWMSSMNWTYAAFHKNGESGVLIKSPEIAQFYTQDFKRIESSIQDLHKKELETKRNFLKDLAMEREKHRKVLQNWKNTKQKTSNKNNS